MSKTGITELTKMIHAAYIDGQRDLLTHLLSTIHFDAHTKAEVIREAGKFMGECK